MTEREINVVDVPDSSAATLALIAFSSAMAGLSAILPMLKELPLLQSIPALYLVVFLPITVLGGIQLFFGRGLRRITPALPLFLITLLGFGWTEVQDLPRALLLFFTFFTTVSFGAALIKVQDWVFAARTFVLFAALAAVVLQVNYLRARPDRLGTVYNSDWVRIIEPNIPGTLSAFAALLGIILLIQYRSAFPTRVSKICLLIFILILLLTLAMTESRGAILSFTGALIVLLFLGRARRSIWLYLICLAGVLALPFSSSLVRSSFLERFSSANVDSYNGRLQIWSEAVSLMTESPVLMFIGSGSGSAGTALGRHAPYLGVLLNVEDYSGYTGGTLRINAHSSYIEWWLAFGTIGVFVGLVILLLLIVRAFQVDSGQVLASGTALITFFLLTSMSLVAYRIPGVAVACGGLTIGYLYFCRPPELKKWAVRTTTISTKPKTHRSTLRLSIQHPK